MSEQIVNGNNLDIKQYFKYVYGITDKEIKDLSKFAKDLIDVIGKFLSVKNKDLARKVIDLFNLFPAYGGFAIFEEVNFLNPSTLEDFSIELLKYYNANKKTEQNSDFIKDLNEIVSALYFFAPDSVLRKILIKEEEMIFNYVITECKNRSGLFSVIASRYGDLFLASKKTNDKYILRIVELFNALEERIMEANDILPEITDALNISLKEIKNLTCQFKQENKTSSLDQLKIILTRKMDLGNLLHHLIIGNESSIGDILSSSVFPSDIIIKCLPQLKIQQLLEIGIILENTNVSSVFEIFQKYIEDVYKIEAHEYVSKTRDLVSKYETTKFGILIRNPMMMPIEEEAKNAKEAIKEMCEKLSTLTNNLTAFVSQSSSSIALPLRSKTGLFQVFVKDCEKKQNGELAGNFASKIKDKDAMKKIKESDLACMNFDQITCKVPICILVVLKEVLTENFKISQKEEVENEAFKLLIKKYKIIITKNVFLRFVNIFFTKIPKNVM